MESLITRYRPSSWAEVHGQDSVVASLKRGLKEFRAFLLSGPSGVGKTTLARIAAAEVGCREPREIDAATFTGIDAMREVASSTLFAPIGGGATVVIIDEAHALSRSAWQSLLKSLEEPPPNTWWFLCTTEPSKVPDTIRTRCQHYDLQALKRDQLYSFLEEIVAREQLRNKKSKGPPDEVVYLCARKAEGSPRRALNLLGKVWLCRDVKEAVTLLQDVDEGDEENPAIQLARALTNGADWASLMKIVQVLDEAGINAETVRITVQAYLSKVARSAKTDHKAGRAWFLLQAFSTPYPGYGPGTPYLVNTLGELYFGQED